MNDPEPNAGIVRTTFGILPDGGQVDAIVLVNTSGLRITVITYGAGIQAMLSPDRDGVPADVALGHAGLDPYREKRQFFGATVGRVANRIAGGRFVLDGRTYLIPPNEGANALHGGRAGFDQVNWEVLGTSDGSCPGVTLGHISPDGDQGFPGQLRVTATYTLNEANEFTIDYRAQTDRPTLVNITNHAYWNLAGEGAPGGAMDHLLTIPAEHFLPTDCAAIPTGEFRPVAGTPFDFRTPTAVSARVRDARDPQIRIGRGYDHNWVIAREASPVPRLLARLEHRASGRALELLSNQPGLQFYSGNFLDATSAGKAGRLYRMGDGIVLEPQKFPDTPNQPGFGSLRLDPDETYRNIIIYHFCRSTSR